MLRNIPSTTLRELVKLSERKEALMEQIQEIDREMARVQSKFGIPAKNEGQRASVTVSRAARGPRHCHGGALAFVFCGNAELALHPGHFAIDLLNLLHECFFALGKLDEFSKRCARNVPQHSLSCRARVTMQLL